MKKLLLIGIFGTYNYGCEAIVRGTANQIRLQYPDAMIAYASLRFVDDMDRLAGSGVEILDLRKRWGKFAPGNVLRMVLEKFGITIEYTAFAHIRQTIQSYDAVFSIGGDIYTLMPGGRYSTNLSHIGNLCYRHSIPYIIWGCSIGPFDKNPKAEKYYVDHLKRVTKIVVREEVTINYLKRIGVIDNVVFAPDPAFYVVPMDDRRNISIATIKKIGINLSPHSALYHYSSVDEAIEIQSREINKLIEILNCQIVLLPHVVSPRSDDDDYNYLKKIKLRITDVSKISVVDNDPGFIGIKNAIKECDVVISARMHCNINAVSCGVPTVFLAYSQKALGMVDFVYKDRTLLMDIKDFNALALIDKIGNLFENDYQVKHFVNRYDMKKLIREII